MLSFHNDPTIKEKYLSRLKEHAKLDNIIQGTGWENGKGCAIGCTLENYNHKKYEVELGIPEWLAKMEDKLFEGMPNKEAKKFPVKFLEAIPVGVDLDQVKTPFIIYVLEFSLTCFDHNRYPDVTKVVKEVIDLYQSGETDVEKYEKSTYAANAAAEDAYYDVSYASYSSAKSAAYAAANAAADASYSAAYYAAASYAAYSSAYSSAYAYDSYAYAYVYHEYRKEASIKLSNKLIELLKECK